MATRQVQVSKLAAGANTTVYSGVLSEGWQNVNVGSPVPYALKVKQVSVKLASAPTAGKSFTYEVMKNGATCGLQIVVSDAVTTGLVVGSVTFAEDDDIGIRRESSGSPTASINTITWVYDLTAPNRNSYMILCQCSTSGTALRGSAYGYKSPTAGVTIAPASMACVVTKAKYNVEVAPGSGKSVVFGFFKNNVLQDGGGGTTNTTVTISDSATSGEWSGSLSLVATDVLEFYSQSSSGGASAIVAVGLGYTTTTDKQSVFGVGGSLTNIASGTNYASAPRLDDLGWTATEATVEMTIGGSGLSFPINRYYTGGQIASGVDSTFTLRKNTADPASGPVITLPAFTLEANDTTNSATFTTGDTIDTKLVAGSAAFPQHQTLGMFLEAPAGGGKGSSNQGGKKSGGGGLNVQVSGAATVVNIGNAGLDIGGLN